MRSLLFFLICFFGIALSSCSTIKSARLLSPTSFGMVQIAPRVYVEHEMPEQQRAELTESIATARQRIRLYFGSVASEPEIIACVSEKCFQRNGGVTARAKAYGAGKLLLSPRGLTAPMIAHELSHAELTSRLGGIPADTTVPRWFDEGLAVLVSNEPTHSEEVWRAIQTAGIAIPPLNELESREKWLAAVKKYGDAAANKEQYKVVYATAGHELRGWYRKAGKPGLSQLIEAVRQGRPFTRAYQEAQGRVSAGGSSAYVKFNSGSRTRKQQTIR